MADCKIIRSGNEVVYTEAPNGERSILFDALTEKLGNKAEALKFWLASKTPKFLSNVAHPKLTKHRVDLLNKLKVANFKSNELTLNINGNKVDVDLNNISFTAVKRIGFNTISAFVKPVGAKETVLPEEGLEIIISPKNEEDLLKVNKYLFGLKEEEALAAATVMDLMIGNMARLANITKEEMYSKIGFGKSTAADLQGAGALFQADAIWKSTAAEGISKVPDDAKFTPNKWIQAIVNKGGKGTANELKWIGMQNFLDDYIKENKVKSIPKSIVEDYIKANRIEVIDVTKEAPTAEEIDIFLDDEAGEGYTREEAFEILNRGRSGDITQYSGYQTPEGENYREVLLTAPGLDGGEYLSGHWSEKNILAHIRMNERTLPTGERVLFLEEVQSDWAQQGRKEGFVSKEARATYEKAKIQARKYNIAGAEILDYIQENKEQATHAAKMLYQDGMGYVATIDRGEYSLYKAVNRFGLPKGEVGDYKVIEDGGSVYIGTKIGDPTGLYYGSVKVAEKNLKEQADEIDSSNREGQEVDIDTLTETEKVYYDHQVQYYKRLEELKQAQNALRTKDLEIDYDMFSEAKKAYAKQPAELYNGIPSMPYKETSQWIGMAMRRVMKLAAEEGFDMISWTTGTQQADRYDLAEQVDNIKVTKRPGVDSYRLDITPRYGEEYSRDYVSPEELPGMVGVELAARMIAENVHPTETMEEVLAKDKEYQKLAKERDSLDDRLGGTPQEGKSWFQASEAAQAYVDKNYSKYQSYTTDYSGLDLKMGGAGMKAFYDKMLPDATLSEAKRFDKKIRLSNIEITIGEDTSELEYVQLTRDVKADIANYDGGKITALELKAKLLKQGVRVTFGAGELLDSLKFYDVNVKSNVSTQQALVISQQARMNLNSAIPLFQNEQGAMVAADSKYIIYALTNPNVSTPLHELAHVYEKYMTAEDKARVLKWTGQESWNTETSESFARGFEKFLAEGKSPFAEIQAIFDNFKAWLTDIYNGLLGSEIDIELNEEMRLVYATMLGADAITVFRGEGNNYATGSNSGFKWVSTEKELAEDYASYTRGIGYNVDTQAISKPKSIFKLHYNANTHITTENLTNHLRRITSSKIKELGLTKQDWKAISTKIKTYEVLAGDSLERYHTKLNKPEVTAILSEILSDLGFDAIELQEGDVKTYGLIKNRTNDTEGETRLFSKSGAKNVNKSDFIGKGAASSQGTRLVEADQVVVGQEVFYQGSSFEVLATTGVNSTIRQGDKTLDIENSKLLVETAAIEVKPETLDLKTKDPDTVNNDALNNEVFNSFRAKNLEPSDTEVLGTSAYVKYLMDGELTVKQAINKAVSKFKKLGASPIHSSVNKLAKGSNTTTPNISYNEAVRNNENEVGDNLWVRNESSEDNKDRVLMVQFASTLLYGKDSFKRSLNSQYFDSLYRLIPGYNRTSDFWEVPLWMASMAGMEKNSDVYVIRNLEEAQKFFDEAKYSRVLFSALDVNEKHIESLATNLPNQQFAIGGYTSFENLSKLPNANIFNSTKEYAQEYGKKGEGVYSYRHFKGTETIPRLKMSEGCTYKCAFCSIPKEVISVPQSEIDTMVDSMQDLDATLVYLDDKTFGQAKNFRALPEIYKKLKSYNPDFEGFIIQTTSVDFADQKKFGPEYLKASGIKYVELGIETYNDDVLTKLNKRHSHKKFTDAAMQNIRANGLKAIPNIVVGLSWTEGGEIKTETAETYQNTYDYLAANRDIISHLNVYSLAIYEGTPLGEAIEVREEADKNENVTTKSWQTNQAEHTKAMDMFSKFALDQVEANNAKTEEAAPVEVAPIKLGRLRYKETATTIEVDSSLLAPLVRQQGAKVTGIENLGIGSRMYSELFKLAIQKGKKVTSSDNLSPKSTKVWEGLVRRGVAVKSGDMYEMKMHPNDFDKNGEPSVNNVLNFVDRESSSGVLSENEIVELKEIMIGMPVGNSTELYNSLKKGFFVEGKFGPTRESLKASNLYLEDELVEILSDGDLQETIKDYFYKLERTEVEVSNDIYTDEAFLIIEDGSKNSIGKFKLANPYKFEKIVISKLGSSKSRQEFEDALFEDEDLAVLVEAYEAAKYSYEDLFFKVTDFKPAAVATVQDGVLKAKQSETEETLENSLQEVQSDLLESNIDFLMEITPTVWAETLPEITKVLREISIELAAIGIDATNLPSISMSKEVSEIKDFLTAVKEVIVVDNREAFNDLVVAYDKFFNISSDYKFKNVKVKNGITEQNVFYVDSEISNIELFKTLGLIAIGKNTFKRVNTTKSVDELYSFIYSKLQSQGYSTILPNEALYPAIYDEDGTVNISKLTDIENRDAVISAMTNYVETKAKEVFVGDSKLPLETLEKFVILTNFYNRSSNVNKFEPSADLQAEYSIFKGEVENAEYLKTDFAADFYAMKLRSKLTNSEKYQNYYSNFSINSTGIHLDSTDPITLNKMKPYLTKDTDLKNYFNLRKGGFNFGVTEEIEPVENELFLRNFYKNFPTTLKMYTGDYQRISDNAITATSKDIFLRLNNGVYEFIEGVGNTGVYAKIDNNPSLFKDYDKSMPAPEIDIDINRIKPTVENLSNKTVIENKYSRAEALKINDKFDNCK